MTDNTPMASGKDEHRPESNDSFSNEAPSKNNPAPLDEASSKDKAFPTTDNSPDDADAANEKIAPNGSQETPQTPAPEEAADGSTDIGAGPVSEQQPHLEASPEAGSTSVPGKPALLIGAGGCALLLCIGFLIGGIFVSSRLFTASDEASASAANEVVAGETTAETANTGTGLAALEPKRSKAAAAATNSTENSASAPGEVSAPINSTMGEITFALESTAAGEPVDPDFVFEAGVTQIHALFEYADFGPDVVWTQVWYHNGNEIFSTSQPWLEAESGFHDYLIDAGGEPLPPGEWALEFYIDGELMTAGSFSIESETVEGEGEDVIEAEATTEPIEIIKIYKLAYTKWNGEKHALYIGDSNGSREQFVLSRVAGPSWSPDGRYIFFYGEEGVDNQVINGTLYPLPGATNGIIRINAAPPPANIGQVRLFQGHGWNDGTARSANVSPDGSMIAYDGDRGGGRRIYFLGTEANQQFRIEIIGEQASWAPDSQRIVYRSGRNNQTGIWISNRTDSGHIRITGGGTDSFPSWSPDGETIAFSRDAGGNVDIYTVKIDGSDLQRLTDAPGHDTLPAYLPNGDIVYRSARTGSWTIWKMKADGSEQVQIIGNAPVGPDWTFSTIGVLR